MPKEQTSRVSHGLFQKKRREHPFDKKVTRWGGAGKKTQKTGKKIYLGEGVYRNEPVEWQGYSVVAGPRHRRLDWGVWGVWISHSEPIRLKFRI